MPVSHQWKTAYFYPPFQQPPIRTRHGDSVFLPSVESEWGRRFWGATTATRSDTRMCNGLLWLLVSYRVLGRVPCFFSGAVVAEAAGARSSPASILPSPVFPSGVLCNCRAGSIQRGGKQGKQGKTGETRRVLRACLDGRASDCTSVLPPEALLLHLSLLFLICFGLQPLARMVRMTRRHGIRGSQTESLTINRQGSGHSPQPLATYVSPQTFTPTGEPLARPTGRRINHQGLIDACSTIAIGHRKEAMGCWCPP